MSVKILRPKAPGFHLMIASIATTTAKNLLGRIYKFDGNHLDVGFFRTRRFAVQAMRAGQQLGNGYMATVMPNFHETDDGRMCVRQWFCFNGDNFVEVKTFRGKHIDSILSIKRAVDKIDLPPIPNPIK